MNLTLRYFIVIVVVTVDFNVFRTKLNVVSDDEPRWGVRPLPFTHCRFSIEGHLLYRMVFGESLFRLYRSGCRHGHSRRRAASHHRLALEWSTLLRLFHNLTRIDIALRRVVRSRVCRTAGGGLLLAVIVKEPARSKTFRTLSFGSVAPRLMNRTATPITIAASSTQCQDQCGWKLWRWHRRRCQVSFWIEFGVWHGQREACQLQHQSFATARKVASLGTKDSIFRASQQHNS